MARIRTIKPEFWTSEQVTDCSTNARLVFIGLWNFCDDYGRHPASPKRLKMEVFPADSIEIRPLIKELIQAGLVEEYKVEDHSYWQVTGWDRHQKIDQPSSKYPDKFGKCSPNVRRTRVDRSPPEGSGAEAERNGVDVEKDGASRPPNAIDFSKHPIDWEQARKTANEAMAKLGLRVPSMKGQDRSLILKGAAIEQFVERVFSDAVAATWAKFKTPGGELPRKSICAYLHSSLAGKFNDLRLDFVATLAAIEVPKHFLEQNGEKPP